MGIKKPSLSCVKLKSHYGNYYSANIYNEYSKGPVIKKNQDITTYIKIMNISLSRHIWDNIKYNKNKYFIIRSKIKINTIHTSTNLLYPEW